MKIMQIREKICYWDATTQFPTLGDTKGKFDDTITFVEAPDYVFEGWGYDETQEGNNRFLKPMPPDGWLYDDATGTFYQENFLPAPTPTEDHDELIADLTYRLTLLELGLEVNEV